MVIGVCCDSVFPGLDKLFVEIENESAVSGVGNLVISIHHYSTNEFEVIM